MFSIRMRTGHKLLVPLALAGALVLGACSGDDDGNGDADTTATPTVTATESASPTATPTEAATETPTATPTEAAAEGESIEVLGVDYAFEGLPETLSVGDTITFRNDSDAEYHELVMLPVPADETRSADELVQLPMEELETIFTGMPQMVLVAGPGEEGMPVLGTGEVMEAGRYIVICSIPVGADPEAVEEAMMSAGDEAPDLGDGAPHYVEGMYAEVTVE